MPPFASLEMLPVYRFLLGSFLLFCLASFTWAMVAFFVQPSGRTGGMQVTAALGVLSALLHGYAIFSVKELSAGRCAGAVVLYGISLVLFWWAIAANRRKPLSAVYSSDAPAHLVQEGPYRWIRHPFYTSYLLAWAAGVVGTGAVWLLVPTLGMLVLYIHAASAEERKFARSPLASDYSAYRRRTGRFVPSPLKLAVPHLRRREGLGLQRR